MSKMSLSQAILLGGMATPQIKGKLSDGQGGTCAMGGAFQAIGKLDMAQTLSKSGLASWGQWLGFLKQEFPIEVMKVQCPACEHDGSVTNNVVHLNDDHSWTRAQIAEWVAQQEAKWESEEAEKGAECTMALMGKDSI